MGQLSDYLPHCTPPDGCSQCQTYEAARLEDIAEAEAARQAWQDHREFVRRLKAWAATRPEPFRSAIRAILNKLERECPNPPPHRRLTQWSGWTSSSRK